MLCFPMKVNELVYDCVDSIWGKVNKRVIEMEVYGLSNRWWTIICEICKYIKLVQEINWIFWLTAIHVDEGRKIMLSKDDLEGM